MKKTDMKIFKELEVIEQTASTNDKIKLLEDLCEDPATKSLLHCVMDPMYPYYIGSLDKDTYNLDVTELVAEYIPLTVRKLHRLIVDLHTENIPRGHVAQAVLATIYDSLDSFNQGWFERIVTKDLRLGIGWRAFTSSNDVERFSLMLAQDIKKIKNLEKKIKWPLFAQPKLDGYRGAANIDEEMNIKSRNGKVYENFPQIVEALKVLDLGDYITDGEVMSNDFQSIQKNAFASKRKTTVGDVTYHIFDIIPREEWNKKEGKLTTHQRQIILKEKIGNNNPLIKYVRCITCDNWEAVYAAHAQFIAEGYEGTILRMNTPYEWKRTDNLMKLKDMLSMDCKVVGITEGNGKYKGMMGNLVLEQENKQICEVGTGFTDEMREDFWKNKKKVLKEIVEIKYQELSKDGIMRFPVFLRFRDDKK